MDGTLLPDLFLIEIRLGRTKWLIKRITGEIADFFSIGDYAERHPHVTLFGPFSLRAGISVPDLLTAVEQAAQPFSAIPFLINGYEMNQGLNGAVIAYRVVPTAPLIRLNAALSSVVGRLAESINIWDSDPDQKWFHVTIANRLDRSAGEGIFRRLADRQPPERENSGTGFPGSDGTGAGSGNGNGQPYRSTALPIPPVLDEDGLRITVMNGDRILAEYDLIQHRWLSPASIHAAADWQRTLRLFRRMSGIELQNSCHRKRPDIFLISDLRLGDAGAIRSCSRPFPHDATDEMDRMLIQNWNATVRAADRIYHLGNLSSGRPGYLQRLQGTIVVIGGGPDCTTTQQWLTEPVQFDGIRFILTHDPDAAPRLPGTWVIHGHHPADDRAYDPFIDFERCRINVSAEVVGYRPVSVTDICTAIREHRNTQGIRTSPVRDR